MGDCVFHAKPATDSRASLPPIPEESCHPGRQPEKAFWSRPTRDNSRVFWPFPQGGGEMPAKRLSMRKTKEVLRLKWDKGLSNRQIAKACRIGRPTVAEYLRRAADAGLTWPLPSGLDEVALEQQLFPPPPSLPAQARGVPDWSVVHHTFFLIASFCSSCNSVICGLSH